CLNPSLRPAVPVGPPAPAGCACGPGATPEPANGRGEPPLSRIDCTHGGARSGRTGGATRGPAPTPLPRLNIGVLAWHRRGPVPYNQATVCHSPAGAHSPPAPTTCRSAWA